MIQNCRNFLILLRNINMTSNMYFLTQIGRVEVQYYNTRRELNKAARSIGLPYTRAKLKTYTISGKVWIWGIIT